MSRLGSMLSGSMGFLSANDHLVQVTTHHDAVFLDQSVWDALGSESWAIRRQAAFDTAILMLRGMQKTLGLGKPSEVLGLAADVFRSFGLGRLTFRIDATGGEVDVEAPLVGGGFVARYGLKLRHRMDALAAGWASAAASIAYPSDWGSFEADEISCVVRGAPRCTLSLSRKPDVQGPRPAITRTHAISLVDQSNAQADVELDKVAQATSLEAVLSLVPNIDGTLGNATTRIGVLPVAYRAQLCFDTIHLLERRSPELVPLFSALAREAAQASGFILVGELDAAARLRDRDDTAGDMEGRAHRLAGLASGLGWGEYVVTEIVPGRRLVLSSPMPVEAVFHTVRHGGSPRAELPAVQGLATALALLTNEEGMPATLDRYLELMQRGPLIHVEETRSVLRGDDECEVVVELVRRTDVPP
jgi:hypothetical protein